MSFCPHCGKEIDDQATFCTHCGSKTSHQAAAPDSGTTRMRLHCPRCKSTRLSAMTESVGSIGSATRVGKRSAIGGTTTLRQRSWTCHDCGNIFRNVDDLAAETAQKFRVAKLLYGIMYGLLFLLFLTIGMENYDFGTAITLLLFMVAITVVTFFIIKKLQERKEKQIEELRKACFD